MPRVTKKKTTTKSVADFEPILYDTPTAPARAPRRAVSAAPTSSAERKPTWKHGVLFSQALLLCIMTGIAGYFYYQYRETPEVAGKREIASLVKKVGGMIELPEGEEPTLATVTNKERLDDQPFFRRAQNGDKILIYQANGRAILYRPSVGKIIDVTVVNIEQEPAPSAIQDAPFAAEPSQPTPIEPENLASPEVSSVVTENEDPAAVLAGVRVVLYNGSTKVGVTNTVETSLQGQFPDIEVILKEKAAKNDYVGYTVVALRSETGSAAQALADALAGTLADLPAGETAPTDADVLVIVGSGT